VAEWFVLLFSTGRICQVRGGHSRPVRAMECCVMDFTPLRKILELERNKGYMDSAVFGGLDKFLNNWAVQAIESISNPLQLRRFRKLLVNTGYTSFDLSHRKKWVQDVFDLLTDIESPPDSGKIIPEKTSPKRAPRVKKTKPPVPKPAVAEAAIDFPITTLRGISSSLSSKFAKLGVRTIRDMLYFFPHRHLDYSQTKSISQLVAGEEQTIIANVWQSQVTLLGGKRSTEAIVGDDTGNVRAVWFNQPFMVKNMATNTKIVLSGRVSLFRGRHVFESPEWEILEDKDLVHTGRLVPVYSLTKGLYPRRVRKLMKEAVDQWAWQVEDFLPPQIKRRCKLLELPQALQQAHYPEDNAAKDSARIRLAFDELFLLQLGVMRKKYDWQESQPESALRIDSPLLEEFLSSLPFKLTGAQHKVLTEILADLQKPQPMSRLLQGDVGSGKTVVATAALLIAIAGGYQGALMAPTEILAGQHFITICQLLSKIGDEEGEGYVKQYAGILPRPLTVALLTGDISQSLKQDLQKRIQSGEIDIAIGTHALIQKGVEFQRLGLAVVDEQHRFGVEQRSALRQKGFRPHMLVMTATPIPRTLALTLYGDLDLSVIDELPPGRQIIKTKWLRPQQRDSAHAFLRKQVNLGHQSFIICPLIEESEAIEAQAAVAEYELLSRDVFPDLKLGLLHGRMSSGEKNTIMEAFRSGEMDILVSTSVVEVGIDVPNATVMFVESADRFGLSQLHQFRGRVGRGDAQSYCILLAEHPSEIGKQRLDIIENVQNGFELAEEDLKLRGPGEFFGTRQSGLPDLRMAKLSDTHLLEMARNEAVNFFRVDATLEMPEHQLLKKELARIWTETGESS